MYKDIISYELVDHMTIEQLTTIAGQIVNDWMKKLPGFIHWEIYTNSDGSLTDIVHWRSREDAKNAEKEMANIPNAEAWYGCYKPGSISSQNLTLVSQF